MPKPSVVLGALVVSPSGSITISTGATGATTGGTGGTTTTSTFPFTIGTPTAATDPTTKQYVDSLIAEIRTTFTDLSTNVFLRY